MGVQENKEAIEVAIERWNAHDESYFELYAPDASSHGMPADLPPNVDGMRAMFGQMWSAFPDIRVQPHQLVAEDDTVALRFVVSGTHEGEFMGAPPTGKQIELEAMGFLKFGGDGKVVERWTRMDEVALLTQLGVMPEPAEAPA
jgi:steroid delta-isomerase-like uncharacterized protein